MGERGPAKEPRELSILKGGKDSRINKRAPVPPSGDPKKPAGLSAAAGRVWDHVMREMRATKAIRPVDAEVLEVYCETVVRYRTAEKRLVKEGPLVEGQKGELVKNPLHQIVRDNAHVIRVYARELGLTPSARSGITLPEAPPDGQGAARLLSG